MAEELETKELQSGKYIIYLILVVLLFAGAGYWLSDKISKRVTEIQEKRAHLVALEDRDNSYQQLQEDFENIKTQYSIIDQALPDQENFISLVVTLEREAKNHNINLNINFSEEPNIQANKLSFQIEISGNQDNVLKYLKSLKKEPYFINIDKFNLSRIGANNKIGGEVTINVGVDETFSPDQISS